MKRDRNNKKMEVKGSPSSLPPKFFIFKKESEKKIEMMREKEKMKNRVIFSVSIAAVLLVISVAAVSADDFSSINQLSGQFNNNIMITTAGDNAIVGDQTINSRNIQAQLGLTVQTGDIVAAGGDISDSSYTYTKSGSGSSGSNSATTNQLSAQFNNNIMITTAGDNATVGDQTINSRNIQAQQALTVQSGDIVAARGDIEGSSFTKSGSGSSGSNSATTNQLSAQFNNNIMITTAGDNATVGDQTINSRNIQAQSASTVQSGDIVAAGGDIEDSTYSTTCPGPLPRP